MRDLLLKAFQAYCTGHLERHKANIENLITANVGVAEHPDIIETIGKEMELVAKYDEQLRMVDKHFRG
tara:strand:- start:132 stop:335 length:204 start_codon:yes stop_codon:yes gene_type:complete